MLSSDRLEKGSGGFDLSDGLGAYNKRLRRFQEPSEVEFLECIGFRPDTPGSEFLLMWGVSSPLACSSIRLGEGVED